MFWRVEESRPTRLQAPCHASRASRRSEWRFFCGDLMNMNFRLQNVGASPTPQTRDNPKTCDQQASRFNSSIVLPIELDAGFGMQAATVWMSTSIYAGNEESHEELLCGTRADVRLRW